MALKTIAIKINDQTFMINQMNTTESLMYFRKLSDLLGDGMAPLVGVLEGKEECIAPLVQALVSKLSEVEIEFLVKDLIQKVAMMNAQPIPDEIYETFFAGSFDVLMRLVMECLKHNYSSFLKIGAIEVVILDS